ncbi:CDP-alcohol phosphatidyltransferase family protein [Deinococcus radiotolerans]|uniref:CDP-alcohol phosphatidyltransferase n=1 Tax=Deinococcus radiotolerans TaxID=1309407 RepID=A0ABQ2FNT8_9DEIO|nr:CDP-alcohol phosphatidyltransferase family protein [Deinococcus radiotolerans]GGL12280.1 hypothetical protein GCM10010844_33650 [Deinococcus radiotolerans]
MLLLWTGLLSDILDGVLARRLGVASGPLRLADSVVDGVFALCIGAALYVQFTAQLTAMWPLVLAYLGTDVLGWLLDLRKFGRLAAYHAYSTKLTGLLLAAAATRLALSGEGDLLRVALIVGILNHLERALMTALLPRWTPDVPTLWHAWHRRG